MPTIKWPSIGRFSLGFKFSEDRENLALVYINYFVILIFSVVVVLLHTFEEKLFPASYRYHALILFALIELWLLRIRWIALARILMLTIIPITLLILYCGNNELISLSTAFLTIFLLSELFSGQSLISCLP